MPPSATGSRTRRPPGPGYPGVRGGSRSRRAIVDDSDARGGDLGARQPLSVPGKYLSLTTYRRDGTPVSTAVWFVEEDGRLFVITPAQSHKAKRLRRNPAATVAPCTARGTPKGDPIPVRVEFLAAGRVRAGRPADGGEVPRPPIADHADLPAGDEAPRHADRRTRRRLPGDHVPADLRKRTRSRLRPASPRRSRSPR